MSEKLPPDTELTKHTVLGHIKAAGWAVVFGFSAYGIILALRWAAKALGLAE